MPDYDVTLQKNISVIVNAANPLEAKQLAIQKYSDGEYIEQFENAQIHVPFISRPYSES